MKTNTPYAPEISTTAQQISLDIPNARSAYWAALPPALRAILSHMVMWFRVYGPVFAGREAFEPLDIKAMVDAAQIRSHPLLNRAAPGSALKARKMSMITALYGFNMRLAAPRKTTRQFNMRQRISCIRRAAIRRFQQTCWTWGSAPRRFLPRFNFPAPKVNACQSLPRTQKPP